MMSFFSQQSPHSQIHHRDTMERYVNLLQNWEKRDGEAQLYLNQLVWMKEEMKWKSHTNNNNNDNDKNNGRIGCNGYGWSSQPGFLVGLYLGTLFDQ